MQTLRGGRTGFLIVSVIAFIILGSLLDDIPAIVLFGPLLFPIARVMEEHDVHYAMIVILSIGLVRTAFRRRLLHRLRHRPRQPG